MDVAHSAGREILNCAFKLQVRKDIYSICLSFLNGRFNIFLLSCLYSISSQQKANDHSFADTEPQS